MPFCPKCKYEYNWGVGVCPDCDERLVDKLPDEKEVADEGVEYKDWIALARLTSQMMAEMVVDSLRSKDIPAVIHSGTGHFGQAGAMGPSSYLSAGFGYTLMVPKEYIDDATQEAKVILGDEWVKATLVE